MVPCGLAVLVMNWHSPCEQEVSQISRRCHVRIQNNNTIFYTIIMYYIVFTHSSYGNVVVQVSDYQVQVTCNSLH